MAVEGCLKWEGLKNLKLGALLQRVKHHSILGSIKWVPIQVGRDITGFFPRIDWIFPWEALNPFFGAQDEGFSEFRSR